MSRLAKIRQMLQAEPSDVFLRYALAMELDSGGQLDESLTTYENLMHDEPPHIPSFFRAGQLLVRMGKTEQAKSVLQQGIRHATSQADHHSAAEMNELLESVDSLSDEL